MANSETFARALSVRDVLDNPKRRPRLTRLPLRLTRRQLLDLSVALDAALVFISFMSAELFYTHIIGLKLQIDVNYTLAGVVTAVIHYVVSRIDRGTSQQLRPYSTLRILRLVATTFAIVVVVGYGLKQAEIHSRLWYALAFGLSFALIVAKSFCLHAWAGKGRLKPLGVEKIALFGNASICEHVRDGLSSELGHFCDIKIYNEHDNGGLDGADGTALHRLIGDGLSNEFSRVVFCLPTNELHRLKALTDTINFLPVRIEACLAPVELKALHDNLLITPSQILIGLDDRPQADWGVVVKRVMDLVLGIALLVPALPIMTLAALAIALDSRGPIFFRQRRHGWNHSVISVWKFRTMTVLEDGESIKQAVPNDDRITRVGRFLRRSSIDELPQLFNVLSGDMSLVGPRPHALAHNLYYSELIATYANRHKVKPGLTGWAQVKGLRGNSEDISAMIARAEADIWYIRNWSLLLDLKILLLTPFALLFHNNAY